MRVIDAGDRSLSVEEAAQVLYQTGAPSEAQVQRVCQLMRSGVLATPDRRGGPRAWRTTESALAELLAESRMRGAVDAPQAAQSADASHQREIEQLRGLYRGLWRDYFLALFLRQRVTRRNALFQHAVTAGQLLLVVAAISAVVAAFAGLTPTRLPAEQRAVEHWIASHTDDYKVTRWHPAQPDPAGNGQLVQVEYRYRSESPRWVQTDRTFRVVGEQVEEVGEADMP